jgi:solute carrier family 25 thiamine pyrophosphate transporter 19
MKLSSNLGIAASLKVSNISDDVFAGAFAGVVARTVSAPFDVLKIRSQLQSGPGAEPLGVLGSFRRIINNEGFFALWKGNLSATYLWVSYAMVQFSVYG